MKNKIQLFEATKIRSVWDEKQEKWWFSVVDIIAILTESDNPRHYWTVLKSRLFAEGNETVTNCDRLKLLAPDGKMRLTDVADIEQILRIIQSISQYKKHKGLKKENLRDNMTSIELALNILAEASATEISKTKNPIGFNQSQDVVLEGAKVAKTARKSIEKRTGKSVISSLNAQSISNRQIKNTSNKKLTSYHTNNKNEENE